MLYAVTGEPKSLGVAGQDTTTLPPEMTTVDCPSQAGTSEARIGDVEADQVPTPKMLTAAILYWQDEPAVTDV